MLSQQSYWKSDIRGSDSRYDVSSWRSENRRAKMLRVLKCAQGLAFCMYRGRLGLAMN